ncbi:ankyrin repeat domain-containing protein SOWAHC-like [Megalops cyprinoides]|uniref:ankyrin repeat domain-containing protein SOWAHC-like n=1 Tax=Megalops cyprinoides TaxID=118141 RepID=UPI0018643B94|nr:ankyrin repeat domain-containing protein SOWAHC-like [Megalops cyprinoides]
MHGSSSTSELPEAACRMKLNGVPQNEDESRCDTAESPERDPREARLAERVSRADPRALPAPLSASARRHRLQRQREVCDPQDTPAAPKLSAEAPAKGSLTSGMRKKYLKELLLNKSRLGSILLSSSSCSGSSREHDSDVLQCTSEESANSRTFWALDPTEHAWMLSVVDGNLDTILDYLREDFSLLTKKDFVTGFTVLHWLAKYGKHETLIKLLRHAEKEGFPVNVNLKASGGVTPLHVAAMHSQHMVIKILVGAFSANVEAMDYSGRRPWQYLQSNASEEMRELLGALDDEAGGNIVYQNANNNSAGEAQRLKTDRQNRGAALGSALDPSAKRSERWRTGTVRKRLAP